MVLAKDLLELSNNLRRLVPEEIIVEATSEASTSALLPEEAAATREWAPQRQLQFAAGRLCARRALAQLGYSAAPIPFDAEGAPVWPCGVVGSISHKRQHCIVVVARPSAARSIGIDLERDVAEPDVVETEIVRRVCGTESERRQLKTLRRVTNSPGTLFLSAKEAFFKFQFPLTRANLDWTDVEVTFEDRGFQARAPGRGDVSCGTGVVAFGGGWLACICY